MKVVNTPYPSALPKIGLVLGGGAPNSTLIAGALAAFVDQQIEFDVISASGAGVLMGLLYTAPKDGAPRQALQRWADTGVADSIYKMLPINYKIFQKPGTQADVFRGMFPFSSVPGVWADWTQLMMSSLSPSDLSMNSLGLCAHLPQLEQSVDFSAVPSMRPAFYINAYNLTQQRMQIWGKHEIKAVHVRAALSFPFLYAPTEIGGDDYIEGAALDTLNFDPFIEGKGEHADTDTLVILDILGDERLLRKPRNLYDAWVRSIITPLVKIAKTEQRLFELEHNTDAATGRAKRRILKLDLMGGIPEEHWPDTLDWSTSNMQLLFDVGYQAGVRLCHEHGDVLRRIVAQAPLAA
ncbi:patatin-like phospholipase family protein [Janthinobacterium agaricidamnosum]|uniref:Patatin-like phospholipase family protein n=1 Tax=Janthinobacterium agaricidamnosum NBRC 102515 = DSM 9628 TaxID=1349767 RepID=W0VDG4_9BURK|nr:patatin-like phospholipase family protein [Janthinobacterium agaricidamnosum]CDG85936.1 patatin-like phospholipase family protein [Janthinobacterium agaricidamnosum NBRC 102515 = DSM 9628]